MQIDIEQDQFDPVLLENSEEIPMLRITEVQVAIEYRSTSFKTYFNLIKLTFFIATAYVLWQYTKTLE